MVIDPRYLCSVRAGLRPVIIEESCLHTFSHYEVLARTKRMLISPYYHFIFALQIVVRFKDTKYLDHSVETRICNTPRESEASQYGIRILSIVDVDVTVNRAIKRHVIQQCCFCLRCGGNVIRLRIYYCWLMMMMMIDS